VDADIVPGIRGRICHPSMHYSECLVCHRQGEHLDVYLPNYLDQFGLSGKVLNFAYAVVHSMIMVDTLYFRRYESMGRVDCLTNMDTLKQQECHVRIEEVSDVTVKRLEERKACSNP
jgi:hypothetical protein